MSVFVELQDRIQGTSALIAQYEQSIAQVKGQALPPSLLDNIRALEKLKRRLEEEFLQVAAELELEVYRYRILNESDRLTLGNISEAWGKFQTFFSSVYSALTKSQGKKPPQSEQFELGYGYSYAGSVGVVVTVPREVGFYTAIPIEDASNTVFDMIEGRDLNNTAKRLGPSPIQALHSWLDVHIRTRAGIGLEWRSHNEPKRSVQVDYQSLDKIYLSIADATIKTRLDVTGELVAVDVETKDFRIKGDDGKEYSGIFGAAITAEHAASVPARYSATITQITKIIVLGKEPDTTLFLDELRPITPG
jgi:hypothetical protein